MSGIDLGVFCVCLTILNCIVGMTTAKRVYSDAIALGIKKGQTSGMLDMSAPMWAFSCFLLWSVALPAYLTRRARHKQSNNL